jgi:glycyl-tRNA synthetase beta chain
MADLLIELFSEEIPARMQARAREDLKSLVTNGLVEAGLTYAGAGAFSTPRRLVLTLDGLSAESRPVREERKGPRTDAPAAALEGFLRSTGLTKDQLEVRDDKKAQVYFAVIEKPGRAAPAIIAEVLEHAIRTFPWPKSMRWGSGSLRWVRPLQSILCILSDEAGAQVVPLTVDGITAGNTTAGHRFLSQGRFAVSNFDDYAVKLKRAHVVLDSAEREAAIWQGAQNLAFAAGLEVVPDAGLLTEVAGLVEWPVPLMGRIADAFLHLPAEVLQTSMKEHQKFFSVKNPKTGRIEGFVTVANTDPADHGATILKGNQKVLSARLSDAKFFWENDLRVAKAGMQEWLDGLKSVTFHNKLGSQADRIARIAALAREIAPLVGADADVAEMAAKLAKADLRSSMVGEFPELQGLMGMYYAREAGLPEAVALAARDHYSPLGPTDTVPTDPVSVAVALADKIDTLTGFWAIDEKPTGSKDPFALRRAALGVIRLVLGNGVRVRLNISALQTGLSNLFDFGWRGFHYQSLREYDIKQLEAIMSNHARTDASEYFVFEAMDPKHAPYINDWIGQQDWIKSQSLPLPLDLNAWAESNLFASKDEAAVSYWAAREFFERVNELAEFREGTGKCGPRLDAYLKKIAADLLSFFHDRLKVFLKDQGIRHDVIDACLAMPGNDDLTLLVNRAKALAAFLKTEDGPNLLQGYKRANTILTQAEQKDGVEYSFGADPKFAETDAERALFTALDAAEAAITPAMAKEDFAAAMTAMATLRAPIDAFFTAVQVNADNEIIRRNRLNLLHRIRAICSGVADLTKIEG